VAGLHINCREAHWLLSRRCDGPLGWIERLALAIHLRGCDWCRRVRANLALLTRATRLLDS
jgi:hypothetical protein